MMNLFVRPEYLEDGSWIRIYPVPLSFLVDLKRNGKVNQIKYSWIELDLKKRSRSNDFRPESYSPVNYDFKDIRTGKRIGTERNWALRKELCLRNVYTNKAKLIHDSKEPKNVSLATYKPAKILGLDIEEDTPEWKDEWIEIRKQGDLFATVKPIEKIIPKLPYKFYYRFTDDSGKESKLMIEDWEIGALYWNCLRNAQGNKSIALKKVRDQYEDNFIKNKDIHLFLGTTKECHRRRATNPFVIIGVFYPKRETKFGLFN